MTTQNTQPTPGAAQPQEPREQEVIEIDELGKVHKPFMEPNPAAPKIRNNFMNIDDKPIYGTPVLNFADVDRLHDALSQTLGYADATRLEIRDDAVYLCQALEALRTQRNQKNEIEKEIAQVGREGNDVRNAKRCHE